MPSEISIARHIAPAIARMAAPLSTLPVAEGSTMEWGSRLMLPVFVVSAPPSSRLQTLPITEIRICDVPDGCEAPATGSFATDTPLTLYAAAYGSEPAPFEGNQPVTWTVSAGVPGGDVSPETASSTTLDGDVPGTIVVTATLVETPTIVAVATFTVTVGSLNSVVIRNAASGGGSPVGDVTLTSDDSLTAYAAGYDADGNFIADQPATWTLQGAIGSIAPGTGASTTLDAGPAGAGSLSAQVQANPTITGATGTLVVQAGELDHFRVSLPANGTAGVGFTGIITAEDSANNIVLTFADGVTLTTTNGGAITPQVVTPTAGVWTGAIMLTAAGAARDVRAQFNAVTGTSTINISAGPVAALSLSPAHAVITAGNRITYTAVASDAFGNPIGNVTPSTVFSITPASGGVFAGNAVTPTIAGRWTVTGTNNSVSANATLTVTAGAPFTLTISPATAVISAGTRLTYTAVATDAFGNFIADVTPGTTFSITVASGGVFAGNVVTPTKAGGWVVTGANGFAVDTASLTVTAGPLTQLTVRPGSASIVAGNRITYTAVASDTYDNPIGDVTGLTAFSIPAGSGGVFAANVVTPTRAGTWPVTGTNNSVTDDASLIVTPAAPFTLTISPATAVISAGTRLTYTAVATDAFGNFIADVTPGTTFSITVASGGVFAGNVVTPTKAGGWVVTGANGFAVDTASLTVTPAAPLMLTISPATAVISAGTRLTYTAVATDAFGNFIGNVTPSTAFSIAPASGGVFAANVVTPTKAASWVVTGANGFAVDTAALTVTPAAFFRLTIEYAPAGSGIPITNVTMSLYNTLTAYAAGYDVYNNLIGPQPATWDASGVANGQIAPASGISTTFTPAPIVSGTGTITAAAGAITDATGLITVQAPVLQISKSDSPDPVVPGELLQYTIVYTNAGDAAAQNVVVTETYPANTSFLAAFPPPSTPPNTWSISSLAPGASGTIQVYVRLADQVPVSTVLTNTVRFGGPKLRTAIYTETTSVDAVPEVAITKTDSVDPVRVGSPLVYTIRLENTGTGLVTGVRVTETYPSQVTFISANPPPSIGNNVWLTDSLGASPKFILVTVQVNSPIQDLTILNNMVTIDTNETDPHDTQEVTVVWSPVLALSKYASDDTPAANSALTYTLRYTNTGSTFASGVVVTDAVPANTTYLDCAPASCEGELGGIVTWDISTVPTTTSGLLTVTVRVNNNLDNGTILTNTARIRASENVSAFASLTSTVTSAPALTLTKSDGVPSAAAGQVLTYTLVYTNSGNAPAQSVVITDQIPSNVTFQNCTPSCVSMGSRVYSFTLPPVNAATTGTIRMVVKVHNTLPAGLRSITNTAAIQTTTPGDNPANNFASDVDTISTVPALALSVGFSAIGPYPTKVITYTVRYTNTSAMDTTGVVISVTKSPFVNYAGSGWTFAGGYVYTRSIGDLPANTSGVATYIVSLPFPFTAEMESFVNIFHIRDNGPGGLPVATAAYTATIGVPDLVIDSVSLSPATVTAGQPFTATIVVRNRGTGRACNPKGCGGFAIDIFIDPETPPPSFPSIADSPVYVLVNPVNAGTTTTVVTKGLVYTGTQSPIFYFKVDSWDCDNGEMSCTPDYAQHGLVPESNEFNNVFGPITVSYRVYLPVALKNKSSP